MSRGKVQNKLSILRVYASVMIVVACIMQNVIFKNVVFVYNG